MSVLNAIHDSHSVNFWKRILLVFAELAFSASGNISWIRNCWPLPTQFRGMNVWCPGWHSAGGSLLQWHSQTALLVDFWQESYLFLPSRKGFHLDVIHGSAPLPFHAYCGCYSLYSCSPHEYKWHELDPQRGQRQIHEEQDPTRQWRRPQNQP